MERRKNKKMYLLNPEGFFQSWLSEARVTQYYRCLGPSTFFFPLTLSTVPLSIGHDNQQWRNLLRDLGPICRQRCSEHCLLKAESITSLLSYFLFTSDSFISSLAWLCHVSLSCHHVYALASTQLTHPLSLIIMLTLICHFCLLLQILPPQLSSLYAQPHSPYFYYFLLYFYWP